MKLHREEREGGKRTYRADGRTDALLGVSGRQEERASAATLSSNGAAAATAAGIHSVQYVVGGSLMWKWNGVYV